MENNPTWLTVVAAVLSDLGGRWLLQKRPSGKRHAGLWEFPGGKVEPGESPRHALIRELNEELGIIADLESLTPLAFAESPAGVSEPGIVILLYSVPAFSGQPVAEDGVEIGWFTAQEAAGLPMPPLDIDLLQAIRQPRG